MLSRWFFVHFQHKGIQMKLSKDNKKLVQVLFTCLALSTLVVVVRGFGAVMGILWLFSFVFFMMCCYAHEYNAWVNNPILKYIVEQSAQRGMTAKETYKRGMFVSGCMFFIIPLLYKWANT